MAGRTLYDKIWQSHTVGILPTGQTQLFIGLHLIHEITTAPAFDMLREKGMDVAFRDRTFATVDHIVPTDIRKRPFLDDEAELLIQALENNVKQFGVEFFGLDSMNQGIVHVIGPQLGLTQPGMTLACGDSHTSTHGAFGTLAFGIGTSQVRDVLATQTLAMDKLNVRRINISGTLGTGVYAKDVILYIIRRLGVGGGKGFAYEYGGPVIDKMNMEERMTVCNMSIEGGALVGYVNPDQTTFDYIKGRPYAPKDEAFDKAVKYWQSVASDADAKFDDVINYQGDDIEPTVTWGINPGQSVGVSENRRRRNSRAIPRARRKPTSIRADACADRRHAGQRLHSSVRAPTVLPDFPRGGKDASGGKSQRARRQSGSAEAKTAEAEGLDKISRKQDSNGAKRAVRCLAMNRTKPQRPGVSASSSTQLHRRGETSQGRNCR
jgi:3-isopropylmalate/(R)-2-methylmalate dehydratase large subunit